MDELGSDEYFIVRRENGVFKLFWKVYFVGFWGVMKWFVSIVNEFNVFWYSEVRFCKNMVLRF